MTKNKKSNLILCSLLGFLCLILILMGANSFVVANAAPIDYTTKTFQTAPSRITVDDEKYVYKISCYSPRGLVDDEDFEDYVVQVSFRASMGCQIYFVDGVACNSEDSSYGDYAWNKYANYYDIIYYDATNHFVYVRFKNLAYLTDDPNVSGNLEDMGFITRKSTYNPYPQRIHYDIFEPTGNFYNSSGSKITSYYYNSAFYYRATDEGEGVSYCQYKKPGSTTWTTYTNGSTISKTAGDGLYTFRAVDKQGNISSESKIYLDTTAPQGSVYANSTVLSSGGSTNASSIYYLASDSGSLSACYVKKPGASSYVKYANGASLTESGRYYFYSIDSAGNISSTYTVLMDNEAPVISCENCEFGDTIDKGFTIRAEDKYGTVTIYYKMPGKMSYTSAVTTGITIPENLSDGTYYFYAEDSFGNRTAVKSVTLLIYPPTAEIVYDDHSNKVKVVWTAENCTAKLNNSTYSNGTWISTEGDYTLVLTNSANRSSTYTFTVGHYYEAVNVVKPTCTEQGYTIYQCISCEASYNSDFVPAIGHTYTEKKIKPTCIDEGYSIFTCKVCDHSYIGNIVEAKGHSYDRVIILPTCTEMGYTISTCLECEYSYISNYTTALGHDYIPTNFDPTCTDKGGTNYKCSRCPEEYTLLTRSELGHDYYTERIKPTCEAEGYLKHICTQCEYVYESDFQQPLGHDYTTWVHKQPDCYQDGSRIHQCKQCKNEYYTKIPCTGHNYAVEETETENGTKRNYKCETCGDEYVEYLGNQYVLVSEYIDDLFDEYAPYMLMVFLATSGIWSIAMGIAIILAYKGEDKIKAKKMVKNYVIGLITIFVILVACPYLIKGISYLVAH